MLLFAIHFYIYIYIYIYIYTQTRGQHMKTQPNRCTRREQGRGKGTRNIGSGVFASVGTHIKDCEVLVRFQVGKSVDKSF